MDLKICCTQALPDADADVGEDPRQKQYIPPIWGGDIITRTHWASADWGKPVLFTLFPPDGAVRVCLVDSGGKKMESQIRPPVDLVPSSLGIGTFKIFTIRSDIDIS